MANSISASIVLVLLFHAACSQGNPFLKVSNSQVVGETEKEIESHFAVVTPELLRYKKITSFGEIWQRPEDAPELIQVERLLLDKLLKQEELHVTSEFGFALVHNIAVMDPGNCKADAIAFADKIDFENESLTELFQSTLLAAGGTGESIALDLMLSSDSQRSGFGRRFIKRFCIHAETVDRLRAGFSACETNEQRASILFAISHIGDPSEFDWILEIASKSSNEVQSAAFFAAAELGRSEHDLSRISAIRAIGAASEKAKAEGLAWAEKVIRKEFPIEKRINNDSEFIRRFGTLACPTLSWIQNVQGSEFGQSNRTLQITFDDSSKAMFMERLLLNKGFGLEAVKGDFAKAVVIDDIPSLLEVRRLGFVSPNELSYDRQHTLDVLIRYLRANSK